jgi:hypothetical protein
MITEDEVNHDWHGTMGSQRTIMTRHFKKGNISIQQCTECAEIHARNDAKKKKAENVQMIVQAAGTVVFAALGYFLGKINTGFYCPIMIAWLVFVVGAVPVRDHFTRSYGPSGSQAELTALPEVASVLKMGWVIGEKPSGGEPLHVNMKIKR